MIITEINRIVLVGKHEYPEKKTTFSSRQTDYQELIYHFSGEATVEFNDQVLQTKKNTIRYLPAGEWEDYFTGEAMAAGWHEVTTDGIPVYRKR